MQTKPMQPWLAESIRRKLARNRRELRQLGPSEPPSEFSYDPEQSRSIDDRDQQRTHLRTVVDRLQGWLDEDAVLRECFRKAGA
jgi:hypothetical protein